MKVLVAYVSQSGNTRKVADAIYEEIQSRKDVEEHDIKRLSEVGDLDGYDLTFVGFPMLKGGPAEESKSFLAARAAGRRIALFVTHASPEDGELVPGMMEQCRLASAGASVVGTFNCQGELAQPVKKWMLNSGFPELRAWALMDNSAGQPDDARLERARTFARGVAL